MRFAVMLVLSVMAVADGMAQAWPSKPVRIVVPYAAGGTSDVLARLMATQLGRIWGQPVIVENRPAAGGVPGTDLVAKANADGYTLLLGFNGNLAALRALRKQLPYDSLKDFDAVTLVVLAADVGAFAPRLFWPLALASVPFAFVGGALATIDRSDIRTVSATLGDVVVSAANTMKIDSVIDSTTVSNGTSIGIVCSPRWRRTSPCSSPAAP